VQASTHIVPFPSQDDGCLAERSVVCTTQALCASKNVQSPFTPVIQWRYRYKACCVQWGVSVQLNHPSLVITRPELVVARLIGLAFE
jgi:hypothetical protein